MCRHLGYARCEQDFILHHPSSAAIAIAEWVYPRQIKMGDDRLENIEGHCVTRKGSLKRPILVIQPVAQPLQKITAVLRWRAAINISNQYVMLANLAWNDILAEPCVLQD